MARVSAWVLGFVAVAGCADAPADSRSSPTLDGFVLCESCAFAIAGVDTLEAESSRGLVPGNPHDVEVTSDGRLAAVFSSGGEPLWFDRAGSVVGPIGQLGEGPGEYRRPTRLLSVPDSLVVFESYGRATVVDLETGGVRTLLRFPGRIWDAVVLSWPDRVAVSYRDGSPVDSVSSIMLFDFGGKEAELIGRVEPWSQLDDERSLYRRLIAPGPTGTFWALDYADYRIVRRDSAGRVIAEARRNAEWAPNGSTDLGYGPTKAPSPWMEAVHQDADGRVWTLARVPRDDWEIAWTSRGITELRSEMPSGSGPRQEELWQSRVEVFSSNLDSLLVSELVPGLYKGFVSDGRLVRYSQTEFGFPVIELLRVRIDDRNRPGSS